MTDHKSARELLVSAIRPALKALGKDDRAHEELLLGSALQESEGLATRVQGRGGPALSYFQMEPFTHDDIWKTSSKVPSPVEGNRDEADVRSKS